MMEQTHTGEGHHHVMLISRFDHDAVTDGSAGFSDVVHAGAPCTFNVVIEGDKAVREQAGIRVFVCTQ